MTVKDIWNVVNLRQHILQGCKINKILLKVCVKFEVKNSTWNHASSIWNPV